MKVYWVQFDYRKNGRANGRHWSEEFVVVGEGDLTPDMAVAMAKVESHGLAEYSLVGTSVQDRTGGFVRGKIISAFPSTLVRDVNPSGRAPFGWHV